MPDASEMNITRITAPFQQGHRQYLVVREERRAGGRIPMAEFDNASKTFVVVVDEPFKLRRPIASLADGQGR
jgi:hypothetical protein